jgi:hypothetical protein
MQQLHLAAQWTLDKKSNEAKLGNEAKLTRHTESGLHCLATAPQTYLLSYPRQSFFFFSFSFLLTPSEVIKMAKLYNHRLAT